ncbi:MAG: lipopolysaccharide biosynthesis protein [Pseudomonadota bacterium]
MDIRTTWLIFRRYLPMVMALTAAGAVAGVILAQTLDATYRSKAVLVVESAQIPDELAATTVQTGENEALQIIRQRILSRDLLLKLANDFDIYKNPFALGADAKVTDLRNRIVIVTQGGQVRRGARDATIVEVAFSASQPTLAAAVANEVVTLILQENVDMRTSVARETLDFFTQDVDRLDQALSETNAAILNFQENNLEALPDSLDFRRSQQANLQERLLQLDREATALQERRIQLVTLFETTGRLSVGADSTRTPRLRPAEAQLAELRAEYATLVSVLSQDNPRMALMRAQIEAAEANVAALPTDDSKTLGLGSGAQMSLFDIQLADLDAQIAFITDQKTATETQMSLIEQTIEATPGNAVTLSTLERTQSNLQEQYNQAVANKARAETGAIIESLSRGQRITVVEQAVAPEFPSSPNRPLVAAGGLSLGLLLALGIVAVLEILNRTIRRPQDLSDALGIQVFATIPYLDTATARFQFPTRAIARSLIVAAVLLGTIWGIDQIVSPLQIFVDRGGQ